MIRIISASRAAALGLVVALGAVACDNPVDEDHAEHAVGFSLADEQGQEVVTVLAGGAGQDGPVVTGQLRLAAGATRTFTVTAIGEDGDRLPLAGGLAVRVAEQPANASLTVQGDRLTAVAAAAGADSARLELLHDNHPDVGAPVPVIVE